MKIRECLVSNSSTTSFCIYGTILNEDTVEKLKKKFDDDCMYEIADTMITDQKLDLSIHCPPDDQYYLGRSWSKVKDDQTGKEFKEDVKNQIKQLLDEDIKLETYEEAWRDG